MEAAAGILIWMPSVEALLKEVSMQGGFQRERGLMDECAEGKNSVSGAGPAGETPVKDR